jgi:carotenoid cleavage dioxygenase
VTKEVWLQSPYLGIIHDIAITQKHVIIPVIARTSSLERLKSGEPMWEWDGSLPTMVGVLPRDGEAKDVRWFKGPSRNTLHFLNATDRGNTVTMELPTSSGERDPSQIRRWTFDLDSSSDAFQEDLVSTTPGFLPRMDDRYLSLDYRYAFISSRIPSATPDPKANPFSGGTQVVQRLDVHSGEIKQCAIEGKVALQESCFVPRANSSSGTHTNWYPQSVLPPVKDELA